MKFKVGDRVNRVRELRRDCYKNENIIIIDTNAWAHVYRYHVKYLNLYNVQNTNVLFWVAEDELVLDTEYYRDMKLKQLEIN